MSETKNPAEQSEDKGKFKPKNVADGSPSNARRDNEMKNVPRGSEGDRRRSAQNRVD